MESMKEALSRDSFKNLYSNFSDDISARFQDNDLKQRCFFLLFISGFQIFTSGDIKHSPRGRGTDREIKD